MCANYLLKSRHKESHHVRHKFRSSCILATSQGRCLFFTLVAEGWLLLRLDPRCSFWQGLSLYWQRTLEPLLFSLLMSWLDRRWVLLFYEPVESQLLSLQELLDWDLTLTLTARSFASKACAHLEVLGLLLSSAFLRASSSPWTCSQSLECRLCFLSSFLLLRVHRNQIFCLCWLLGFGCFEYCYIRICLRRCFCRVESDQDVCLSTFLQSLASCQKPKLCLFSSHYLVQGSLHHSRSLSLLAILLSLRSRE